MGRKSRFTDGDVHESVAELLRGEAVVSIQGISRAAGISVGSLYHRFGSRDGVLTACWLDAVGAFQAGFLAALERSGREAALATPRFCLAEPSRARILASQLPAELGAGRLPHEMTREVRLANRKVAGALNDYASGNGLDPVLCRLAIIEMPLTVVRMYLPAHTVPAEAVDHVARAYDGLMGR